MNQTNAPAESAELADSHSVTDTRLYGHWLILARTAWYVMVLTALALFVMTLPIYFVHLQMPCLSTNSCSTGQLTPGTIRALSAIGLSISAYALFIIVLTAIQAWVGLAIAVLLLWKKSDNWMALLIAFMLAMQGISVGVGELSVLIGPVLANVLSNFYNFVGPIVTILIFCLFPNGRFVPRWTRWLVVFTIVIGAVFSFIVPSSSSAALQTFGAVVWFSLFMSVAFAQLYRYRHVSTPVERQQTKWVVFSLAVGGIVYLGLFFPEIIFPTLRYGSLYDIMGNIVPSFCANLLLALSFGIAILRYRLYDIDILIRRTLIYGMLTVLLTLVYVGLIFLLQSLLRGLISQTNDVAIVVSTLTIAALFQPLRRSIQSVIDRRFYRRKYDAARTLAAFSATLRNEVDLGQLREQLLNVVQDTMQPAHISLWLRSPQRHTEEPLRRVEKARYDVRGFLKNTFFVLGAVHPDTYHRRTTPRC